MSTNSEDVLGKKLDHCLADTLIKLGVGIGVGSVLSLIFFKRKAWPITMGFGTGLGMGIANCQNEIQDFRKLFNRSKMYFNFSYSAGSLQGRGKNLGMEENYI